MSTNSTTRRRSFPGTGTEDGPLVTLLILLTVVTGVVDAFSYLELGRVFVANMTGNVVFLSFDLGGAPGFLWWASLLAIGAFLVGALLGGRITTSHGHHRGRHVMVAITAQTLLVAAAFIVSTAFRHPYGDLAKVILILLLGIAMGLQNATARALSVPDLTTTVLTLTIAGIGADNTAAGGKGARLGRRSASIASMFVGGLVGAAIVIAGHPSLAMLLATVLLAVVAATGFRIAGSTQDWAAPRGK